MRQNLRTTRLALILVAAVASSCGRPSGADPVPKTRAGADRSATAQSGAKEAHLVLAGGCFWCMEVAFDQLKGVSDVVSGYAGGSADTADYQTVSAGLTKHAESIRITYDPNVISTETLLKVFFTAAHDPTQVNRQFPDVGRQYRSTVFYANQEQQQLATTMIDELNQSGKFDRKIATTLEPLDKFYLAEDYHQDYVKHHPSDRYVVAYSIPKVQKVRKAFPELIRKK